MSRKPRHRLPIAILVVLREDHRSLIQGRTRNIGPGGLFIETGPAAHKVKTRFIESCLAALFSLLPGLRPIRRRSNPIRASKRYSTTLGNLDEPTSAAGSPAPNRLQSLYTVYREDELRKLATPESTIDCVITMDQNGRITEFNDAAEQTFGYRRADLLGKDLADHIIPPGFREAHRRCLERYLKNGDGRLPGQHLQRIAMRADGSLFPVELSVKMFQFNGQAIFTASLRDITESKRVER